MFKCNSIYGNTKHNSLFVIVCNKVMASWCLFSLIKYTVDFDGYMIKKHFSH